MKSTATQDKQLLSFAQERLWFIDRYEGGTNAYNISMIFELSYNIKLNILKNSIKSIIDRHEILRTLIKEDEDGIGYQLISEKNLVKIRTSKVVSYSQLDREIKNEIDHIYDLSHEYPIRIKIYKLDGDTSITNKYQATRYYLSILVHHIAFDGWSVDIFLNELQEYYNYYLALSEGKSTKLNLADLNIQYKDFALWQRNYLTQERLNTQLQYWRNKLNSYSILNLREDNLRPKEIDYIGKNLYFEIEKSLSDKLRDLAKELKVSLYTVLLSGYHLMLRSYSNQDDIVIGTPAANRHYSQIEHLIGFFVNSLPLRIKTSSKILIKEFIQIVGNEVVEAQLNQDLPFEKLVEELHIQKDSSRHPVFQVMFGVQSFGNKLNQNGEKDIILKPYTSNNNLHNISKFDISTFIDDSEGQLRGVFEYSTSLYTEGSIRRFVDTYIQILQQLSELDQIEKKICDLNYLTKTQYKEIIYSWSQTEREYPEDKTIHELFEEQVAKTPDNIAIVYEDIKLTYRELNQRANQLAHYLRTNYNIRGDDLVVLCLDRSEHMLVAILGVLKAGGAYVPIDPSYPDDRIEFILNDTKAKVLLANEINGTKLKVISETKVELIDSFSFSSVLNQEEINNPLRNITSQNLAYVIYTSGTTGKPKGVMIGHKGVTNTILSLDKVYDFSKGNRVTAFTSYVFDVSVSEFFTTLFKGGQLYLLSDTLRRDHTLIKDYIITHRINYIYLPPILLSSLDRIIYKSLKGIIYAGESCDRNTGKYWSQYYKLYNYYGPTEAAIYTSAKQIISEEINLIGKPISNTKCYILNKDLKPLSVGAIGELYVSGVGLAQGYLNKPDLTAEKFIANPFRIQGEINFNWTSRLYKTGDLVRYLPDGNIEYIGRSDFQVKIRGYRIELEEIENTISSYCGIKQSVVIAKEYSYNQSLTSIKDAVSSTSNKLLIGYYVSDIKLKEEDILSYLKSKLPEYMIPNVLVHLQELPLTINGKLNRELLPDPELTDNNNYVEPQNELEHEICKIWSEVLGLPREKIGIYDNFFDIGGNSITVIKIINEAKNKGIKLNVKDLFSYSTIAKLANKIVNKDNLCISTKTNLLLLQDIENNLARTDTKVTYDSKKNINNILLTGATGFLGQHLLIDLLESTTANIYCLIRANSDNKNVQKKLDQILIRSGNIKYVNNPRVICIEGDLSKPNLGLSINTIVKLEKAIDIIYHCGAYVHHLYTYENLREANVLATIELVKLATTKKLKQLHYISTLGTTSTTEENIWKPSESLLSSVGYIQSKWVCEKILWSYIERNYPFYIYRPGNITGHTDSGFCIPKNNHLLLLLKGIIQIRVAPKWDMPFEMVPVNKVSNAIISLSLNKKQMSRNIFNLHNSQSITWKNYLQIINNITNLKMKFVNTEYFLINILPNIGTDNAMYPIKNFYESRSIDNIKLLSDQETQKYLRELNVTYPSQKEYIKLLNLYIEYLVKIGFLNIKKL
ncbi:MAG TPA: amino acid adenylation domain-containing protein [Candidatus Megaira endosymbiont of Stentor roeselii]|nr:amino acid adenylation domain-containing protein [Candidatus Megaera endosymbiont of Stentor roeselii]